jgi:hypothetical protein
MKLAIIAAGAVIGVLVGGAILASGRYQGHQFDSGTIVVDTLTGGADLCMISNSAERYEPPFDYVTKARWYCQTLR